MLKIGFCWGFAPDSTGRAHRAPADPIAALKGPLRGRVREKEGKGGEGEGRQRMGKDCYLTPAPFSQMGPWQYRTQSILNHTYRSLPFDGKLFNVKWLKINKYWRPVAT
jgi:hypothetical protein